jgi:hypothetical protein
MKKAEIIIAILSIIALGLNILLIPGGGVLTVLTVLSLSMIYFYFGFAFFNEVPLRLILKKESYNNISSLRLAGAIGAGLALSITLIGILFKFQSWPGASINLGVGLFGLLIVFIIGIIKYFKTKSSYYTRIFKRGTVFGGLALILFLIPKTTWIEIKYRDQPAFVAALKKAMATPDNKELWDNVDAERQKMNEEKTDGTKE